MPSPGNNITNCYHCTCRKTHPLSFSLLFPSFSPSLSVSLSHSLQVILNSPKLIEEEKAKMASKEKALKEKEGKTPSNKTNNTVNGTGGTPIHVNTLQVNTTDTIITLITLKLVFDFEL